MYLSKYVIDLHDSPRAGIHFDFRIKYPNKKKLASFALPKARFPRYYGEKLLAVRTPDHDMVWLTFEGDIPNGKSGTIKKVQYGIAEISYWSDKIITLYIDGHIASGNFVLVYMGKNGKNTDWIIMKKHDK